MPEAVSFKLSRWVSHRLTSPLVQHPSHSRPQLEAQLLHSSRVSSPIRATGYPASLSVGTAEFTSDSCREPADARSPRSPPWKAGARLVVDRAFRLATCSGQHDQRNQLALVLI